MAKWLERTRRYFREADEATRRKRYMVILAATLFVAVSIILCLTVGKRILLFVADSESFRAWVDARGIWGKLAYIGIVLLQIVVAIIPGEPIELCGGYAFGAWQGLLLAEIGMLIGSACVFLFVKRYGRKAVDAFISADKLDSLSFLQKSDRRNAIVFLLFFIPGTPKDILTYFAGLTPMKLGEWLLITSIARIPSVVSSTLTGAAMGDSNYTVALVVYGVTAVVSIAGGLFYKKFISRRRKEKKDL